MVVILALLAFRVALLLQQVVFYIIMLLVGCTDATFVFGFVGGLGGPHASGVDSCSSTGSIIASTVAIFIGFLIAIPILVVFMRGWAPKRKLAGGFLYLFAIGLIAETLASAIIFTIAGQYESAVLVQEGVPAWVLVLSGLAIAAVMIIPIRRTTPYFAVDVLGHDPEHTKTMEKAIWLKLSVGVVIIALIRIFI